jgi:hypothetical protein
MRSNAAKGTYYKMRSKRFLEEQGYEVGFMERLMLIHVKDRQTGELRQMPIKQDQFASDLVAIRADVGTLFVQVKFGRDKIAVAVREFFKHPFPSSDQRVVHVWTRGARAPEVINAVIENGDRLSPALAPLMWDKRQRRSRRPAREASLF